MHISNLAANCWIPLACVVRSVCWPNLQGCLWRVADPHGIEETSVRIPDVKVHILNTLQHMAIAIWMGHIPMWWIHGFGTFQCG